MNAYGAVLAKPSELGVVRDQRSLPYSKKDSIKHRSFIALKETTDVALKEQLKVGYISLAPLSADSQSKSFALFNRGTAPSRRKR